MFLTRISINHPVFATMMMVMILVLGLFSYGRLGVDHYPETDLPVVVVATTYTGASPESVESEISRPIEAALNTIGGIDTITSESYEGRSIVVVQFEVDVDSQDAAQEVRDRVARLETKFPDGDCQEFCAVGRFHQLKNRSPKMTANCVFASTHS
ncbi:efflux RND transporter permease subunit, partial [Sinorhizobium meliloti]|uniref:efflux RND transporter permease subunit n=1 Tax=Rhizobium meliloti TaxID=382 RepID=UPI001F2AA0EC